MTVVGGRVCSASAGVPCGEQSPQPAFAVALDDCCERGRVGGCQQIETERAEQHRGQRCVVESVRHRQRLTEARQGRWGPGDAEWRRHVLSTSIQNVATEATSSRARTTWPSCSTAASVSSAQIGDACARTTKSSRRGQTTTAPRRYHRSMVLP